MQAIFDFFVYLFASAAESQAGDGKSGGDETI